jgi:hypothetical protein
MLVIGLLIISFVIGFAAYTYTEADIDNQSNSFYSYVDVVEYEGNLTAGIDVGNLSFGRVNPGTAVTRTINLNSSNLTLVNIGSQGNISEVIDYKDKHLFTNRTPIHVRMKTQDIGFYEGNVSLDIKTGENEWGELWLKLLSRF